MIEQRRSPLVAQVILFVAFLAIAVVGVFTVIVPELTSDDAAEEGAAEATEAPEPTAE